MGFGGSQKKWQILPLDVIFVLHKLYVKKVKCLECGAELKTGMVNKKWTSKGYFDTGDLSGSWSPYETDFDITRFGLVCTIDENHRYWSKDFNQDTLKIK